MVILLGFVAFILLMVFAGFMEWRAYRRKKTYGRSGVKSGVSKGHHKRRN